jgi:hypothetical protein
MYTLDMALEMPFLAEGDFMAFTEGIRADASRAGFGEDGGCCFRILV